MNDFSLSERQTRLLRCVLNQLVPPSDDGRLPGAGELGIAAVIEDAVRRSPELGPVVAQGLAALEASARQRDSGGFETLSASESSEVVNEVAATQPAFVPALLFHSYGSYYQNPRVLEALGLEPRPPHPKGYDLEPGDLTLLDPVRRRSGLYREV